MTPLPIARLLADLRDAGVELAVRDGRLMHRPKVIDSDIAARLAAHKTELISAVGGETAEPISWPAPTGTHRHEQCRMCRRSLWWALRVTDQLWTCAHCHPPHAILGSVFWRGADQPTVRVTGSSTLNKQSYAPTSLARMWRP